MSRIRVEPATFCIRDLNVNTTPLDLLVKALQWTIFKTIIADSVCVIFLFYSHSGTKNSHNNNDPKRDALRILLGFCSLFQSSQPNDQENLIEG